MTVAEAIYKSDILHMDLSLETESEDFIIIIRLANNTRTSRLIWP